MSKIVRINVNTKNISSQDLVKNEELFGGRYLTSKILAEEVPANCHPLGKHNKLIIAGGVLAGTLVSSVNRLSIGAKSPLTGGIKESNAGGTSAYMLAKLGIRAIVLEDIPSLAQDDPDFWQLLYITKDKITFKSAKHLLGLDISAKAKKLYAEYGSKIGLTLIGVTGEKLMNCAAITNADPDASITRYNGRGGLGAVMGSKGIIALVYDTENADKISYADRERFNELNKQVTQNIQNDPQIPFYREYGTAAMLDRTQASCALPTRNFTSGQFEKASEINAESLHKTILARGGVGRTSHACMPGCIIQCSNIYPDVDGNYLCSPLEYENLGLLGSNLAIGELDAIAKLNNECNEIACDTIEMGAALGVLMHAKVLEFGNFEQALEALNQVREATPFGRILGSGAEICAKVYASRYAPVVKGQAMPAYEPRGAKRMGLSYAICTQGADHTAGNTMAMPEADDSMELTLKVQFMSTMPDILGFCLMAGAGFANWQIACELIQAKYAIDCDLKTLYALVTQTLAWERKFNIDAGYSSVQDDLPEFMHDEENIASKTKFEMSAQEINKALEQCLSV